MRSGITRILVVGAGVTILGCSGSADAQSKSSLSNTSTTDDPNSGVGNGTKGGKGLPYIGQKPGGYPKPPGIPPVSFDPPTTIPLGNSPRAIEISRFDVLGYPLNMDIAVIHHNTAVNDQGRSFNVSTLIGNGLRQFPERYDSISTLGPSGLSAGDFNIDGYEDLAILNQHTSDVRILVGDGTGELFNQCPVHLATPDGAGESLFGVGPSPTAMDSMDLDEDGIRDFVTFNRTTAQPFRASGSVRMGIPGDCPDFYYNPPDEPFGTEPSAGLILSDLDRRRGGDIIYTAGTNFVIEYRQLDGRWSDTPSQTEACQDPRDIDVADLNGDGWPDLVAVCYEESQSPPVLKVKYNQRDGYGYFPNAPPFNPEVPGDFTTSTGSYPIAVAVGDLNGDGRPDIATAHYDPDPSGAYYFSVFVQQEDHTFVEGGKFPIAGGVRPRDVAIGSMNPLQDSRLDVVVANEGSNNIVVFFSQ